MIAHGEAADSTARTQYARLPRLQSGSIHEVTADGLAHVCVPSILLAF